MFSQGIICRDFYVSLFAGLNYNAKTTAVLRLTQRQTTLIALAQPTPTTTTTAKNTLSILMRSRQFTQISFAAAMRAWSTDCDCV